MPVPWWCVYTLHTGREVLVSPPVLWTPFKQNIASRISLKLWGSSDFQRNHNEPNVLLYVQCAVYASVRVPSYRVAAWCGFLWCVGVSQSSATTFPMFFLQQGCFAMLWVEYRVCAQWTRIENSISKILMGKSKPFFVAYMVCRCQKKHKSTAIVLSLNCLILTSHSGTTY